MTTTQDQKVVPLHSCPLSKRTARLATLPSRLPPRSTLKSYKSMDSFVPIVTLLALSVVNKALSVLRKCCIAFCALMAALRLFSCKTSSVATLAKSSTSSVTMNEPELVDAGPCVVLVVVDEVVDCDLDADVAVMADVSCVMVGLTLDGADPPIVMTDTATVGLYEMLIVVSLLTAAAVVVAAAADVETAACSFPELLERPSNVTSAFSATHDRLASLKRARIVSVDKEIE